MQIKTFETILPIKKGTVKLVKRTTKLVFEDMDFGSKNFPFQASRISMKSIDMQYLSSNAPDMQTVDVFVSSLEKRTVVSKPDGIKKQRYDTSILQPQSLPTHWEALLPETLYFHMHPYCEISYFLSGKAIYICNNCAQELVQGDIIVFNSNTPHYWFPDPDNVPQLIVYNFYPSLLMLKDAKNGNYDFIASIYSEHAKCHILHPSSRFYDSFVRLLTNMENEFLSGEPYAEFVIKANILELTVCLARAMPELERRLDLGKQDFYSLKKAIDFIHANYTAKIYVSDLAKISSMNANYFSSYFKKKMGMPVVNYINNLRIAKAAEMLVSTENNVQEIGDWCGFSSTASFYRAFKSIYNMSPQQYRTLQRQPPLTPATL